MSGEPEGEGEAFTARSLDSMFERSEPRKEPEPVAATAPEPESAEPPPEQPAPEGTAPAEAAPTEPPPPDAGKPSPTRDEQGRFAKGDPAVALRQARDEAASLKRRIAELEAARAQPAPAPVPQQVQTAPQQPAEAPLHAQKMPDPVMEPERFADWLEARDRAREIARFERDAIRHHGAEKVQGAIEAAAAACQAGGPSMNWLRDRIRNAEDPFSEAIRWQDEQSKPAADIEALKAQLRAEIEAELSAAKPPASPQAPNPPANPTVMPSNFAGLRSTGSGGNTAFSGPRTLDQIFGSRSY